MRRQLAPLVFDADPQAAPAERASAARRTPQGALLHSFHTLLADWATSAQHWGQPQLAPVQPCDPFTRPTPLQKQALDLPGLRLERTQSRISANRR